MNNATDDPSIAQDLGLLSHRSLKAKIEKVDFLDLLIRSLDVLIFLEIGILYCCDNLSLLLAIRAINQVLWVQPKPISFGQNSLAPTIVGNVVSLVTHVLHSKPLATARSAHGYIHGGLLVDFVGELGPITKWRLVGYDILIAALQILMLMIGHEKRKLSGEDNKSNRAPQDLESEEAGLRKSQEGQESTAIDEAGIEMDSLLPSGSREAASSSSSRTQPVDDLIASVNMQQTLRALTRRNAAAAAAADQPASTETDERAAHMRALLSRLIANRVGS